VKHSRRMFFHLAAGAAALPFTSARKGASLSDRAGAPHRGLVPPALRRTPARLIAQWLSERLGQQFIMRTGGPAPISLPSQS